MVSPIKPINIYQELPSPLSIRLLHLYPGVPKDSIHCSFSIVSLIPDWNLKQEAMESDKTKCHEVRKYQSRVWSKDKAVEEVQGKVIGPPFFEAVSYVWGDRNRMGAISINKKLIRVPFSLVSVLRRLWDEYDCRTLWADAVCIDQTNLEEKRRQVGIMENIYQQARRVLFCLKSDSLGRSALYRQTDEPLKRESGVSGPVHKAVTHVLQQCPDELQALRQLAHSAKITTHRIHLQQLEGISPEQWVALGEL